VNYASPEDNRQKGRNNSRFRELVFKSLLVVGDILNHIPAGKYDIDDLAA
jgi:hypothetical protein